MNNKIYDLQLFNILSRNLEPSNGFVSNLNKIEVGYLKQDITLDEEKTIFDVVTYPLKEVVKATKEYFELSQNFDDNDKERLEKISDLQEVITTNNGWDIEERAVGVLAKLALYKPITSKIKYLSGGERIKVSLAQVLLKEPDLLLLDEPTNHLDLFARLWLENFLREYRKTVLVVSHDRNFLDSIVEKIWHLKDGVIKEYAGNFSQFYEEYQIEKEKQLQEYEDAMKKKSKIVKRFEETSKRVAKGHMRYKDPGIGDKYQRSAHKKRAENLGGKELKSLRQDKEKVQGEILEKKPEKEVNFYFKIGTSTTGYKNKPLVSFANVSIGYDDKILLEKVNLVVKYGDRIAIFGNNGSGKTTIFKAIQRDSTVIVVGANKNSENYSLGIIDQTLSNLPAHMPLEEMFLSAGLEYTELRKYLSKFLFSDSVDVKRKIESLSGGEKLRVSLALLTIKNPDLILLDEPTNNLDFESIETLIAALNQYEGALVVISHDLYFLSKINVETSYLIQNGSLRLLQQNPKSIREFKEELLNFM